jgi:hypothetical protein
MFNEGIAVVVPLPVFSAEAVMRKKKASVYGEGTILIPIQTPSLNMHIRDRLGVGAPTIVNVAIGVVVVVKNPS